MTDERRERWLWDTYAMHREQEAKYQQWCAERGLDPELGTHARQYEEELVGQPIEEWWDAMAEAAAEEARFTARDGGARL